MKINTTYTKINAIIIIPTIIIIPNHYWSINWLRWEFAFEKIKLWNTK